MAKLVFGMNQSLDGYVDHTAFAPSPTLFRHFIEEAQRQAGSVYGRQMYEVMRYWDDDHPEWDAEEQPALSRTAAEAGGQPRTVRSDLDRSSTRGPKSRYRSDSLRQSLSQDRIAYYRPYERRSFPCVLVEKRKHLCIPR
jgi:hypothetical protein